MVWEQYGWIIPVIGYNLVAIPMTLGKFPPAWFPAPNIRGKEEFCRKVVFRILGAVCICLELVLAAAVALFGYEPA